MSEPLLPADAYRVLAEAVRDGGLSPEVARGARVVLCRHKMAAEHLAFLCDTIARMSDEAGGDPTEFLAQYRAFALELVNEAQTPWWHAIDWQALERAVAK